MPALALTETIRRGWSQSAYRSAISTFAKTGDWQNAFYLLHEMHRYEVQSDVVMYNATINTCKGERWQLALSLLLELERDALEKDDISFNSSIGATKHQWPLAMLLFVEAQDHRQADLITRNTAISAAEWQLAIQLLADPSGVPDAISFNTAISSSEKWCQWQHAMALLREFEVKTLQLDVISFSAAISACGGGQQWELAIQLLQDLQNSRVKATIVCFNAVIAACGSAWQKALVLFDETKALQRSIITYNSTASACVKGEQWQTALSLLHELPKLKIQPNVVTLGIKIGAFEKGRQWHHALWTLFHGHPHKNHSLIAVNSAITACEKCEKWQHALMLLNEIWHFEVQADVVSFSAAISACSRCEQWEKSLYILRDMMKKLQLNVIAYNAAIDACAGRWLEALDVLREVQQQGLEQNVITWGSSITAVGQNLRWQRAISFLQQLESTGLRQNEITYSAAVVSCELATHAAAKMQGAARRFDIT